MTHNCHEDGHAEVIAWAWCAGARAAGYSGLW